MAVAGGTISAKVEGSTDSARGTLHIFREPWRSSLHIEPLALLHLLKKLLDAACLFYGT